MKKILQCPGCKEEFDAVASRRCTNGVQCPSCLATIPVFEEDTWVPEARLCLPMSKPPELNIEGYEIHRILGQGGMGFVFEGIQLSLGRRVAVKVLAPNLACDRRFVERFDREAAALASLAHPNIVMILERGRSNDSVYFIMEYVEGIKGGEPTDLRAIMNDRQLSDNEVKHIVFQIASALAYSHERGVVHRDIKPGNVMIDRHGNAKVADFGIASVSTEQTDSRLTAPSMAVGTLDYMSPEQREGNANADHRADVYSLGILVYELLTGKIPRGAYAQASVLVGGLDPLWDKLISHALQPQPGDRLASMQDFLRLLDQISTSTPPVRFSPIEPSKRLENERLTGRERCPECKTAVTSRTRYCPSCRTQQWIACPECDVSIHAGVAFCPTCGTDMQKLRQCKKYIEMTRLSLAATEDVSTTYAERCHHANQAGLTARRAINCCPGDETAQQLLKAANRSTVAMAIRCGDQAYREKKFAVTLSFLEQILEIEPTHAPALRLFSRINNYKKENQDIIQEYLASGSPRQAIVVLEKLISEFPEDVDFANQLADCREKQCRASEIVERLIPSLAAEQKWYGVQKELNKLNLLGVQVHGIESYALNVETRIARVEPLIQSCEVRLSDGMTPTIRRDAESILQIVSDHPRALAILAAAEQKAAQYESLIANVERACSERRWFRVDEQLCGQSIAKDDHQLSNFASAAEIGRQAADEYARLLLWSLIGGAMLLAVELLARLFAERVPEATSPTVIHLQYLLSFGIFAVGTACGMFLLRALVGRPVPVVRFLRWTWIWLSGVGIMWGGHFLILKQVDSASLAALFAHSIWAISSSLVIAMAGRDLLRPPIRHFGWMAIVGTVVVMLTIPSLWLNQSFMRFFLPSLWIFFWMLITRLVTDWRFGGVIIVAGLFAGVVTVATGKSDSNYINLIQIGSAIILLAFTAIFFKKNRSYTFSLLASVITAVAVLLYEWTGAKIVLTSWWAIAAYVVYEAGPLLDSRLHLIDRYRKNTKMRSVAQLESPVHF